ncbi:glycoside hydrolase family 18 protein [Sphingobacterium sp. ML3W]|uniref:glycoside hydrolase family 18 protein n=1 Tax=Sphingobacterium sp. ML3W TaxID=1538644 RepID=UPI00249B3CF3|nr:glycoside hydrolase family 18 protein [Sphingobacterium sp. ML3W]WFA79171.1 glycoside hydrolase family 18 protein [Sphingobacterium sp. ML3W]
MKSKNSINPLKLITLGFTAIALLLMTGSPQRSCAQGKNKKVVIAYVTSWSTVMPDPTYLTHINYAFGHVNDNFDGVRIDNEARLKSIIELKKAHPHLKVLLSIGGWGSGRFSEMAANVVNREKFAKDCERVVKEFKLDGIDIDWEYPTNSSAGISAAESDTENFTLLMRDIRKTIGRKKLLTLASVSSGQYIAFDQIKNDVDFVNIMTYDSGNPPYHHASLHRSPLSGRTTCAEAVKAHIAAGMPAEKLVLGIPFYGRGNKTDIKGFIDYKDLLNLQGFEQKWDNEAKAHYLVNAQGELVLTFETPESIALKCDYVYAQGLLGAMYWEYAGDTEGGVLRDAVYKGIVR